jgi:YggT family protein
MFYQVISFLLQVLVTLVGGACVLRLYMHWQRMSLDNPVGRLVQALSGRLVQALQRWLPVSNRLDAASLLAAWLLKLLQYAVLMAPLGASHWSALPVLALLGTIRLALLVTIAVLIVAAILSWTHSRTLIADVFNRLCAPWLAPLRRRLPLVGGVDFSPLVLIVALQVVNMVLHGLQGSLLGVELLAD